MYAKKFEFRILFGCSMCTSFIITSHIWMRTSCREISCPPQAKNKTFSNFGSFFKLDYTLLCPLPRLELWLFLTYVFVFNAIFFYFWLDKISSTLRFQILHSLYLWICLGHKLLGINTQLFLGLSKYQHSILTKKYQWELDKAEARLNVVEGLIIAIENIDEVVKIIKESTANTQKN